MIPKVEIYKVNDKLVYSFGMYGAYKLPEIFYIPEPRMGKKCTQIAIDSVRIFTQLLTKDFGWLESKDRNVHQITNGKYKGWVFNWWYADESIIDLREKIMMKKCVEAYKEVFPVIQIISYKFDNRPYYYPESVWTDGGALHFGLFPHKYPKVEEFADHFGTTCYDLSCAKEAKLKCSRCKSASFCSQECSKKVWNYHKEVCDGGPMYRAIFEILRNLIHMPYFVSKFLKPRGIHEDSVVRWLGGLGNSNIFNPVIYRYFDDVKYLVTTGIGNTFVARSMPMNNKEDQFEENVLLGIAAKIKESESKIPQDKPTYLTMNVHGDEREPYMFLLIPLDFAKIVADERQIHCFFSFMFFNYMNLETEYGIFQIVYCGTKTKTNIPPWHPDSEIEYNYYESIHPLAISITHEYLKTSCCKPFCSNANVVDSNAHDCHNCCRVFYCSEKCREDDKNRHKNHCKMDAISEKEVLESPMNDLD